MCYRTGKLSACTSKCSVCIFVTSGMLGYERIWHSWLWIGKNKAVSSCTCVCRYGRDSFHMRLFLFAELFTKAGFQEQSRLGKSKLIWERCFWFHSIYHHKHIASTVHVRGQVNVLHGCETEHCQYYSRGSNPGHRYAVNKRQALMQPWYLNWLTVLKEFCCVLVMNSCKLKCVGLRWTNKCIRLVWHLNIQLSNILYQGRLGSAGIF